MDMNKDISDLFKKARKGIKPCLIIIEEIDLLIQDNITFLRTLQDEMDGHESNSGILVLATSNNIYSIPNALSRDGRFNYMININNPTIEDYEKLFSYFFAYANLSKEDIKILSTIYNKSVSSLKALKTEAKLRLGMHPTLSELERLISLQEQQNFVPQNIKFNYDVAIHEAGHVVVAYQFRKYYLSLSINICSNGRGDAMTLLTPKNDCIKYYDFHFSNIIISLAGNIASKYCGHNILGNETDMKKAYDIAKTLVDIEGKSGAKYVLDRSTYDWKSQQVIIASDKKIHKIIEKAEKISKRIIKRNKDYIYKIADALTKRNYLNYEDIQKIMNDEKIYDLIIKPHELYQSPVLSPAQACFIKSK